MEDSLAKGLSSFSFCVTMVITSVVSGDGSITKEDTLSKQFYDAK